MRSASQPMSRWLRFWSDSAKQHSTSPVSYTHLIFFARHTQLIADRLFPADLHLDTGIAVTIFPVSYTHLVISPMIPTATVKAPQQDCSVCIPSPMTDVDNMEGYQMIAELTEFMLGFYGTLHCVELQKLEIVGYENPCHAIVEALAKKLEELLAGRRILRPANGGQLSC